MLPAENQDEQTGPETGPEAPPPARRKSPLRSWWRAALCLLVLASLVAGGTAAHRIFGAWGWVKLRTGETQRVLEVKGQLDFDSRVEGDPWQNAGLVFMLPEIRASYVAYQKDLSFNEAGEYSCRIFYVSRGPLHYLNVRGFCSGFERQDVNGIQIAPDSAPLVLPRITLVKMKPGSGRVMPSRLDPGEPGEITNPQSPFGWLRGGRCT